MVVKLTTTSKYRRFIDENINEKYLEELKGKLSNDQPERVKLPLKPERFVMVPDELLKRGKYLTPTAKWLYVTLRSFTNIKNGQTFPSYKKIMERGGMTHNGVAKTLAETGNLFLAYSREI